MQNKFSIGSYQYKDSLIHKMNPIPKIITSLIFSILILSINNISLQVLIYLYLILNIISSEISIKYHLKQILHFKYLLLIIYITNVLTIDFLYATIILNKFLLLFLNAQLLLTTTKTIDILSFLNILLKPLRIFNVNYKNISFTITYSIIFFNDILNYAYSKIVPRRTIKNKRLTFYKYLLINIFQYVYLKIDEVSFYIESRSIEVDHDFDNKKLYPRDIYFICINLLYVILLVYGGFFYAI